MYVTNKYIVFYFILPFLLPLRAHFFKDGKRETITGVAEDAEGQRGELFQGKRIS